MSGLLDEVKNAARFGQIIFSDHADDRSEHRSVGANDVRYALLSATHAKPTEKGRIEVSGGKDRDGDELLVVVRLIRPGLIVITFY
jgi:hypothetical protein